MKELSRKTKAGGVVRAVFACESEAGLVHVKVYAMPFRHGLGVLGWVFRASHCDKAGKVLKDADGGDRIAHSALDHEESLAGHGRMSGADIRARLNAGFAIAVERMLNQLAHEAEHAAIGSA